MTFTKRLSFRLTRNTVLLAMALGVLLNMVQVTLDYFTARKSMDEEIRALMDISFSPASQIAYNIDTRLAKELLDGLLRHPAIIDARIVDPDGRVLAASSRRSTESTYRVLSDFLFGSSREYSENLRVPQLEEIPLGQLEVRIDTYHYGTAFLSRAGYTLFSGFIKSLILSIILLFVFYFILTKPLMRVIQALREVEPQAPEKVRLPIPGNHQNDEIGQMVGIINEHLDTIDSSLDQVRLAESKMKHYSSKLEREVEDRTREISEKNEALQRGNRALIRAKEDAVHRARSRANFLASMSHEIRTPLNGVLGMLELALDGEMSPSQRNRLEIARNAGQSLLGLLNDILDISKVEAGKLSLEAIEFSLRDVIEECATLLNQQARGRDVQLVIDIDPALPETFQGDPTRVRQIINNLLGNGIKFTEAGEVRIRALCQDGETRIDVIDTGIGMTDETLRRIFSPFAQGKADTTRRFGGTGLGLTLCRQLVERMHGQITVESRENRGTHFTVILPLPVRSPSLVTQMDQSPLRDQGVILDIPLDNPHRLPLERQLQAWQIPVLETDAEQAGAYLCDTDLWTRGALVDQSPVAPLILFGEPEQSITNLAGETPRVVALPLRRDQLQDVLQWASGERAADEIAAPSPPREASPDLNILLVEDNRVNQIVASSMLRKLGYRVDLAENGERALAALRQQDYDIVLMDCQMPVMDGYAATGHIRKHPQWKHLPVIAVTANVMQGDKEDCLAAGMNDYVTKPYNKDELRAVIERWAGHTVAQGK
ncbi:hybrid sensor histidine kinase/response regulator [Marinobacter bohaiensis]|uniref:hybrid sensor histidine kinase/response regulator n=1 Tax=Marinobacter bohaiensis TaxID=2201898 RepID=UPI000DAE3F1C|nr:ATP-binding protein [Marinobacter bohaiensis]